MLMSDWTMQDRNLSFLDLNHSLVEPSNERSSTENQEQLSESTSVLFDEVFVKSNQISVVPRQKVVVIMIYYV